MFHKLREVMRRAPRRTSAVLAMVAAVVVVPAALFAAQAHGTYSMKYGAPHVVFNSITDNTKKLPEAGGDERQFIGVRENGTNNPWTHKGNLTIQPGKEYQVRLYVHNDAAYNFNLVAKDVQARVGVYGGPAKSNKIMAAIGASNVGADRNGNPGKYVEVFDDIFLNSSEEFTMSYVPGSGRYGNDSLGYPGAALPDSLFSTGAKLGWEALDGNIPGCSKYSGWVTFVVRTAKPARPSFDMKKQVSKHGANQWQEHYAAQPGETVDFKIDYRNTGNVDQNIAIQDMLPKGLTYVPGSAKLGDSRNPNGKSVDDSVVKGGLRVDSYKPGESAWVILSAKVDEKAVNECQAVQLTNKALVQTSNAGSKEDGAVVTTKKDCEQKAMVKCDAVTSQKLERTKYRFSVDYSLENATFKNVTFIVRDNSGKEVERKTVTNKSFEYTQTKAGSYTVEAVLTVNMNGKDQVVTDSNNCKQPFTIEEQPKPGQIEVCDLTSKQIIKINEDQFDSKKHSKNLKDCEQTPVTPTPPQENCPIPGKEHLPKDSDECKDTPVVPAELPQTGATGEHILIALGLGALVSGVTYYVTSRRLIG